MKKTFSFIALVCLIAAPEAHANRTTANICAASLQPHARLVFDAVNARPNPEQTLRTLIEARVRELVFTDRLMMTAARPAAEAASQCLRISRDCSADRC